MFNVKVRYWPVSLWKSRERRVHLGGLGPSHHRQFRAGWPMVFKSIRISPPIMPSYPSLRIAAGSAAQDHLRISRLGRKPLQVTPGDVCDQWERTDRPMVSVTHGRPAEGCGSAGMMLERPGIADNCGSVRPRFIWPVVLDLFRELKTSWSRRPVGCGVIGGMGKACVS